MIEEVSPERRERVDSQMHYFPRLRNEMAWRKGRERKSNVRVLSSSKKLEVA